MVKYPKSVLQDGETHTLKNKATINLVGLDGATDTKTATRRIKRLFIMLQPSQKMLENIFIIIKNYLYDIIKI